MPRLFKRRGKQAVTKNKPGYLFANSQAFFNPV
jgi:hypothetical protein